MAGWQEYALQMVIEEGFGKGQIEYNLLITKKELAIIASALMEEQYYSGLINRTQVIKFYQENAFLNKWEAEILQMRTDLDYLSGTQAFIGTVEFNTMLTEYKKSRAKISILQISTTKYWRTGLFPCTN